MQAAHAQFQSGWREHQPVVHRDAAGNQRAGDDKPSARQRKGAINGQPRMAAGVALFRTQPSSAPVSAAMPSPVMAD